MEHAVRLATPFVIALGTQRDAEDRFAPCAQVTITPELRLSGLLAHVSDDQARTLLAVMTHVSANGDIRVNIHQIAAALALPERQVRHRLNGLTNHIWKGQPLLYRRAFETGGEIYIPARALLSYIQQTPVQTARGTSTAPRAEVISSSRAQYARPREEVERLVEQQLGHAPEESERSPRGAAYRMLISLGLSGDKVSELLHNYPVERILQQIAWLPERNAKMPGKFIVAAIEGNYSRPVSVKLTETNLIEQPNQREGGDEPA